MTIDPADADQAGARPYLRGGQRSSVIARCTLTIRTASSRLTLGAHNEWPGQIDRLG
jgi:hypothetical protein